MKRMMQMLIGATTLLAVASASAFDSFNGHWWNPHESGTGYNIDVRNGMLVMTVYSYTGTGAAQWYLAAGMLSADGRHFAGDLQTYSGGQCISCSYAAAQYAGSGGTVTLDFATETLATLHLPGGRVTVIEPYFPSLSSTGRLDGTYRLKRGTVDFATGPLLDSANGTITVDGKMIIAGDLVTQTVTVTTNGTTVTMSGSGTFTDYGSYVVMMQEGQSIRAALITRSGASLITETMHADSYAGVEIDQWELVDRPPSLAERDAVRSTALPGRLVGALLSAAGLR